MDLTQHKTLDLQGALIAVLTASEYWEGEWHQALGAARRMETFREWDTCIRAKAEIKAELARRGARDFDWTAPRPPRRLP